MPHAFWLDRLAGQSRTMLRVQGRDTLRFVQGMVSADVRQVKPGVGKAAALLTVKGKMISDAIVVALGENADQPILGIVVPSSLADDVLSKLRKHAIMDEVEIDPVAGTAFAGVPGEASEIQDASVQQAHIEHPLHGVLVWGSQTALATALADFKNGDEAEFAALRITQGVPAWGHELRPDFFPPEVGFVQAVSYNKGCYLGQEPLARIHARGQTNWVMVRVRAAAATSLVVGALSSNDRPNAGHVTTVSDGPNEREGLAIVHRKVAQPATLLHLTDASDQIWEVISGPLGADLRD